jgi:hypothetical protein
MARPRTTTIPDERCNMPRESTITPLFGEQGILIIGSMLLILCLTAGVCLTMLFHKNPEIITKLIDLDVIRFLTTVIVVFSSCVLSAQGVIPGEVVGGLLSGIVGYVLGSSTERSRRRSSTIQNRRDAS